MQSIRSEFLSLFPQLGPLNIQVENKKQNRHSVMSKVPTAPFSRLQCEERDRYNPQCKPETYSEA